MTLISTTTVTVNAAFLQEIKEDNRELRQLLEQLRRVFTLPKPPMRPRQIVALFGQLRDQLAMHFALEEAYGYFEDAVSVAPRLSREANELRNQHGEMFLHICDITEQAERSLYGHEVRAGALRQIGRKYACWYERFQQHESRETNLVLEAFNDDIGVGD